MVLLPPDRYELQHPVSSQARSTFLYSSHRSRPNPMKSRGKGVQNTPALLAWGIPLALAAAVLIAGLVPVYFLFPPAWVRSPVLYVLFARLMGAAEEYPDGVAADRVFAERVEAFHAQQAREAPSDVDTRYRRALTRLLRIIWII